MVFAARMGQSVRPDRATLRQDADLGAAASRSSGSPAHHSRPTLGVRARGDVATPLHRLSMVRAVGRTQRAGGDQPAQTKVGPVNAPMRRYWPSVHIPSTSFTSAGYRPPRLFTQTSGHIQAFRARQ